MSNEPVCIQIPENFPIETHHRINEYITSIFINDEKTYKESWGEFVGGWTAILYRFISCYEHYLNFIKSLKIWTNAPPPPERYIQERELYGFFTTGFSVFESFFYSIYAIGSIFKPKEFSISNSEEKRRINDKNTKDAFKRVYHDKSITITIERLLDCDEYKQWKTTRNVLAHRSVPSRHIFYGGEQNGEAHWLDGNLDENFINNKFNWLSEKIKDFIHELDNFISDFEKKQKAGEEQG